MKKTTDQDRREACASVADYLEESAVVADAMAKIDILPDRPTKQQFLLAAQVLFVISQMPDDD